MLQQFVLIYFLCIPNLIISQTDWDIRANMILPPTNYIRTDAHKPHDNDNDDVEISNSKKLSSGDLANKLSDDFDKTKRQRNLPKDCLESLDNCQSQSGICKVDLGIFRTFCGDWMDERSLLGCQKKYVKECRSALLTMNQGRPGLKHCTCDSKPSRSIDDLVKCNLLWRNLNSHPCLQEPPILLKETSNLTNIRNLELQESMTARFIQNFNEISNKSKANNLQNIRDPGHKTVTMEKPFPKPEHYQSGPKLNESHLKISRDKSEDERGSGNQLSRSNTENSRTTDVTRMLNENNSSNNLSCLELLEECTQLPACTKSLNQFRAVCTLRSCEKLKYECLDASKRLEQFGTQRNCSCQKENDYDRSRRCMDYEKTVINNACIDFLSKVLINVSQTSNHPHLDLEYTATYVGNENFQPLIQSGTTVNQTDPPNSNLIFPVKQDKFGNVTLPYSLNSIGLNKYNDTYQKRTSINRVTPKYVHRPNCYSVFERCIQNRQCLSYYVLLESACSTQQCAMCTDALRKFLTMNSDIANDALICHCLPNDSDCLKQEHLFTPQCIHNHDMMRSDCFQSWIDCQSNSMCRNNYELLTTQCRPMNWACRENLDLCLDAYKTVWRLTSTIGCSCKSSFQSNHLIIYEFDDVKGNCEQFRQIISEPPCKESLRTKQLNEHTNDENIFKKICYLTEKFNFKSGDFIRLHSEIGFVRNTNDPDMNCTILCQCPQNCPYELCMSNKYLTIQAYLLNTRLNQSSQLDRLHSIPIPHQSLASSCLLFLKIDTTCTCTPDRRLFCNLYKRHDTTILQGYRFIIQYDVDQFAAIQNLLHYPRKVSGLEFYHQVHRLEWVLSSFMDQITNHRQCRLLFVTHRNASDSRKHFNHFPRYSNQRNNMSEIEYDIAVVSANQDVRENSAQLCLNTVKIINLMINQRYSAIAYHSSLSTITKSTIITQNIITHSTASNRTFKTDPSQSWRQSRTSYQPLNKQTQLQNNHSKHKYKSNSEYRKSILSISLIISCELTILILYQIWFI